MCFILCKRVFASVQQERETVHWYDLCVCVCVCVRERERERVEVEGLSLAVD